MNVPCNIRPAKCADFERIYRIEAEAFMSPWTVEGLVSEMASSRSHFLVAEHNGKIVGYALVWFVADEVHLLKIATADGFRRCGVASSLIEYIFNKFSRASAILLEVREKNSGARCFYKKLGFVENGIRKKYYPDDNAVLIEKKVRQAEADQ